ncbi:PREDICTED: NEDD8-conjugating enzyme Ubc12-like [Amphimedon queenslandica]|uniref:UBC core domain-containing protein n=1 Tax=Amphimedon queenslandica TaxID=400682 RepID=A0A1X7V129_AMPQE|nr:PREDICTED: NEDD8-conjugating enzyme Ubc12-like [Amphimedon queenslandica]|eukprot:XP_003385999.1 PREDICTED: NEDD8-conjugating enzyme Ubc12-like [Amphimedon queenslandica]
MASRSTSEIMKQYKSLVRGIELLSDGQAAITQGPDGGQDEDDLSVIYVSISPNDGPYKGGSFVFKLDLSDGYPDVSPPVINCLTKVYHPNIDAIDEYSEGEICLNLLDELWNPDLTLEDYVQGLLFLFYNPNLDDPLNPSFSAGEIEWEEFEENVRKSLMGYEIEGVEYEPLIQDVGEDKSNEGEESEGDDILMTSSETSDQKELVTVVTTDLKSGLAEKSNSRDDATGQREDVPVGVVSAEAPPPPVTVRVLQNGLPLIIIGVGVWAGLSLMRRFAVR